MIRFKSVNKPSRIACGCLAVGLLFTGCAANKSASTVLVPSQSPVAMGLAAKDLTMAAEAVVTPLLESGIFDRAPHHPAVLAISVFQNATSQQLDTSLLMDNIRVSLLKTGKAVVTAKEQNVVDLSPRADFLLSGKVSETRERTGSIKQSTYVFSFSLADNKGLTLWAENKMITKLVKRDQHGF